MQGSNSLIQLPSPAEFIPSQGDWFPETSALRCTWIYQANISQPQIAVQIPSNQKADSLCSQERFSSCLLAHQVALDFPDPCPTPVGQGAGDSTLSSTLIIAFDVESYKK